jgi:lipid-A-disaccharide synthase-like uncharacterized protein
MPNEILMYGASGFYFLCYIPELYANYVNKNANFYNVPEKVVMLIGTLLAITYALQLNNIALILNYGLCLLVEIIALGMRLYYAIRNHYIVVKEVVASA